MNLPMLCQVYFWYSTGAELQIRAKMEMPVQAVCLHSCPALRNTLHWWTPIKDLIKSEVQFRLQADWQCRGKCSRYYWKVSCFWYILFFSLRILYINNTFQCEHVPSNLVGKCVINIVNGLKWRKPENRTWNQNILINQILC